MFFEQKISYLRELFGC